MVQGIAHLGRAIAGEVVVAIARVLGLGVLGQCRGQRGRLRGIEIQPLQMHAATDLSVVIEVLRQRQRHQHVLHPAAQEARDEAGFFHVEVTEVVAGRLGLGGIIDHDGIVTEAFPEHFARAHGQHADARNHGRRGRRRGRGQAATGKQQYQRGESSQQSRQLVGLRRIHRRPSVQPITRARHRHSPARRSGDVHRHWRRGT